MVECWTVPSYHVTYAFQSESTLNSCLNVKELLARSRREIWSLSDCNWSRTQNDLVRKRTLNHLVKLISFAKWLRVRLRTNWFWVRVQLRLSVRFRTKLFWVRITLLSLKLQILRLLRARSSMTFECGFTLKILRDMIITYSIIL